MTNIKTFQQYFYAGEISPRARGILASPAYQGGVASASNMIVSAQGGLMKRPGTRYVGKLVDMTKKARLIPFSIGLQANYVLAIEQGVIKVYSETSAIETPDATISTYTNFAGATPAIPWVEADIPKLRFAQSGDVLFIVHPDYVPIKISRTSSSPTFSASEYVNIDGPYLPTGMREDYTVYKTLTITPSAVSGSGVTLTASASFFKSTDVGRVIRLYNGVQLTVTAISWVGGVSTVTYTGGPVLVGQYVVLTGAVPAAYNGTWKVTGTGAGTFTFDMATNPGGVTTTQPQAWCYVWGSARITAYSSGTSATCQVFTDTPFGGTSASIPGMFMMGVWGDNTVLGYPNSVALDKGRMIFVGNKARPRGFWASKVGYLDTFSPTDNFQLTTVLADSGISLDISSSKVNALLWAVPGISLGVGGTEVETVIDGDGKGGPIGPLSFNAQAHTHIGSTPDVHPVPYERSTIFVDRYGRRVYDWSMAYDAMGRTVYDLTQFSDHITKGGLVDLALQRFPEKILWGVRSDGILISGTYSGAKVPAGWCRHPIGDAVESVCVIPTSTSPKFEQLWLIVKRTINGATKRYIEKLSWPHEQNDAQREQFYVDCGINYSGTATSTITGLAHLEGKRVSVLANGEVYTAPVTTSMIVTSGQVVLDNSYAYMNVGLPIVSEVKTLPLVTQPELAGYRATLKSLYVNIYETIGGFVLSGLGVFGTNDAYPLTSRPNTVNYDTATPLQNGELKVEIPPKWDREASVYLRHEDPANFGILNMSLYIQVGDQ